MNLLSVIQSQLSSQTVNQISSAVGESPGATKSALSTAFPALLGSLVGKATASPTGATEVYNMVREGGAQGGWPDSAAGLSGSLGGGTGNALSSSLLGSKLGGVTDFLASHCGIKSSSASSLLGMAAPLLMGTISKQVSSQGLGAGGLGQLLSSQTQYLKDAIPSGLANTLGIGNMLGGGPEPSRMETAGRAEAEASAAMRSSGRPAEREPVHATQPHRGGFPKWAWVPALLALALVGWLIGSRSHKAPATGGTGTSGTEVQSGRGGNVPNLQSLDLTSGGIADKLAKAVSSGNVSQTFAFQGQSFDSAGNLTDSGRKQAQEVGSVLKAVPNLNVSVIGYGSTEDAGLSQANAIKSGLASAGVSENRVATSGQVGNGPPTLRPGQ